MQPSFILPKHIINVQNLYFKVVYLTQSTTTNIGRKRPHRKLFKLGRPSIFGVRKRTLIVVTVRHQFDAENNGN